MKIILSSVDIVNCPEDCEVPNGLGNSTFKQVLINVFSLLFGFPLTLLQVKHQYHHHHLHHHLHSPHKHLSSYSKDVRDLVALGNHD